MFAEKTFENWSGDEDSHKMPEYHKPKITDTAIVVGRWKYDLVSKETLAKKRKTSEMAISTDETPATPKRVKNARAGMPSLASSLPTVDSKPVKPSKNGAKAYCQ
ncbi:hypothetical protein LQW54_004924 [Pestalotiopsis sp. IQ-011]